MRDPEQLPDLREVIWTDPDRMSGMPCFFGTRVPVQMLFDHLEAGSSLDDFLDGFEGVTREQATAVLAHASRRLLNSLQAA
jgi:uncharacterized protein (DUF433 family)